MFRVRFAPFLNKTISPASAFLSDSFVSMQLTSNGSVASQELAGANSNEIEVRSLVNGWS